MMNFLFKMMNFVFKMMDFVFKMLNPKDVLFLFYDELLTEHRGCVKRIAEFMQLSIDRSMILTHR